MAKSSTAIHTLLELAERACEKAAADLAMSNSQLQDSKNQLDLLNDYRQEYVSQNFVLMVSGVQSRELLNFRAFLSNLDKTIVSQHQIIDRNALAVQEQQAIWQESERKKMSYQILTEQEKKKILILESKRDQKLNDEFVNARSAIQIHKSRVQS